MVMPDVSELFLDPEVGGGQAFQMERTSGEKSGGQKVDAAPTIFNAVGSIQPAQPKELERLPEEDRIKAVVAVRSTFKFQMGITDGKAYTNADVILSGGNRYRILKLDDWSAYGWSCAFATLE